MNLDPEQLDALHHAVVTGTFDGAARALSVTPSAVSQRIKALERTTGQVLLVREKPVRATPAGETLLRLAVQLRSLFDEAEAELTDVGAAGRVPVIPLAVNADSLATWVLPALRGIASPAAFDLHRDDQERTVDLLRAGRVMAAITTDPDPVPGCSVHRLGTMRYRPTACPTFLTRWFAEGVTSASLASAPVVVFDRADTLQDRYLRRRTRGRATPPRHFVPSSADFVEAVRLGLGWGMLPDLQVVEDRRRGRLVDIDPHGALDVRLFWQQWRIHSALLGEVADAVRAAAAVSLR